MDSGVSARSADHQHVIDPASAAVARYIYSRATANGKCAQCQGGAKNPVIILSEAEMDTAWAGVLYTFGTPRFQEGYCDYLNNSS